MNVPPAVHGDTIAIKCNAIVANTGIDDIGGSYSPRLIELDEAGKPRKSGMITIDVNLVEFLDSKSSFPSSYHGLTQFVAIHLTQH
ncbi:mediator of rna polymerase ii transcription subunit 6 [Moniliophthora roreri]|nr:mediator of rna polymerase ii transcription subunit 6 [Moniliophthora roreri]